MMRRTCLGPNTAYQYGKGAVVSHQAKQSVICKSQGEGLRTCLLCLKDSGLGPTSNFSDSDAGSRFIMEEGSRCVCLLFKDKSF